MGMLLATLLLTSVTASTDVATCRSSPEQARTALAEQREADRRAASASGSDPESSVADDVADPLGLVGDEGCGPTLDAYEQALRDQIPYEHRGLDATALAVAHADEQRLFRLGAKRIESAFAAGSIVEARLRIARMTADERHLADPSQRADPPRSGKVLARLAELDRVVGGGEPAPVPTLRVPADWSPTTATDDGSEVPNPEGFLLSLLPDAADALLASGRPEQALQLAIDQGWIDLVVRSAGGWRLVELGEQVMGRMKYREAVEQAVRSIRIEQRPAGRYAAIPLLGRWRPLPLSTGTVTYDPATPLIERLQDHARALLAPQRMRVDRVIDCIRPL